jgi:hypothetical protein
VARAAAKALPAAAHRVAAVANAALSAAHPATADHAARIRNGPGPEGAKAADAVRVVPPGARVPASAAGTIFATSCPGVVRATAAPVTALGPPGCAIRMSAMLAGHRAVARPLTPRRLAAVRAGMHGAAAPTAIAAKDGAARRFRITVERGRSSAPNVARAPGRNPAATVRAAAGSAMDTGMARRVRPPALVRAAAPGLPLAPLPPRPRTPRFRPAKANALPSCSHVQA